MEIGPLGRPGGIETCSVRGRVEAIGHQELRRTMVAEEVAEAVVAEAAVEVVAIKEQHKST